MVSTTVAWDTMAMSFNGLTRMSDSGGYKEISSILAGWESSCIRHNVVFAKH